MLVPFDRLCDAVRYLGDQRLFSDVAIELGERRGDDVYLVIRVEEMPRLTQYGFSGVKRGEQETLRGKLDLVRGQIVNENLKVTTRRKGVLRRAGDRDEHGRHRIAECLACGHRHRQG